MQPLESFKGDGEIIHRLRPMWGLVYGNLAHKGDIVGEGGEGAEKGVGASESSMPLSTSTWPHVGSPTWLLSWLGRDYAAQARVVPWNHRCRKFGKGCGCVGMCCAVRYP
eukprot:scaffold114259_cov31-Tisochrysis_lutea.AAC.6